MVRLQQVEAHSAAEQGQLRKLERQLTETGDIASALGKRIRKKVRDQQAEKQKREYEAKQKREQEKKRRANRVFSVPIAGNAYVGRRFAKVTMVQFFDFACPYCERVHPTIEKLQRTYGRDLKVVYKYFYPVSLLKACRLCPLARPTGRGNFPHWSKTSGSTIQS